MSIADELALLANTKENLRVSLGLSKDVPFSQYILSTPFTPRHLFISGEQGAWYDPSDLSTLFQDAAGTTPVTADGDPVGLLLDKSGNGNHAAQPISASRPTYRTDGALHWLEFDGIDDHMIHNISLNGASTVIAAAERTGTSQSGYSGLFTVTAAKSPIKSNLMLEVHSGSWGTFAGSWRGASVNLLGNRAVVALTASGGLFTSNIQTMYTNGINSGSVTGGYPGDGHDRMYLMRELKDRVASGLFFGGVAVDVVLAGRDFSNVTDHLAHKSGVVL